ncbi:hypothetical protein FB567DRAFT_537146 [Paraphoma chrysanthemicola]|uniref:Uncharacterized protein n=1 Tax=Paraphoma chrysanthemicola TaxID=798071 RepID=A0A8K0VUB4_9PLEO|nr:hypothetical protein FB567DRAFT_537146 [Paraphoma chrysanthemicola]
MLSSLRPLHIRLPQLSCSNHNTEKGSQSVMTLGANLGRSITKRIMHVSGALLHHSLGLSMRNLIHANVHSPSYSQPSPVYLENENSPMLCPISLPCIGPSQTALQQGCEEPLSQDNSSSLKPVAKPRPEHYATFIASEWEMSDVVFASDSYLNNGLHAARADSGSSIPRTAHGNPDISLSHANDLVARKSSDIRAICLRETRPNNSCGVSGQSFSSVGNSYEPLNDRPLRPEQENLITSMMKFTDAENVGPAPHDMYEHFRQLVQECGEITERQVASWDKERIARARIVDNPEDG